MDSNQRVELVLDKALLKLRPALLRLLKAGVFGKVQAEIAIQDGFASHIRIQEETISKESN